MADKENSSEVLGTGAAAYISPSTPGRGFVRRGPGNPPTAFQSARVAGRRPGQLTSASQRPLVSAIGWSKLGQPAPRRASSAGSGDPNATDLHALVELISAAAIKLGVDRRPSPWLPALPADLTLASLAHQFGPGDPVADGVLLGLLDQPSLQAQVPLRYRIQDGQHLLIAGAARSGRSSVLRTLVAGLVRAFTADDLHLYGIDFGNALRPMAAWPHTGAIVSGIETERITRLVTRLVNELARRQLVLAERGFGDINEQRAVSLNSGAAGSTAPLPFVLVVIDRWDAMASAYPLEQLQGIREQLVKILRDGPATGVSVVVTGDHALLSDRIANYIDTRYALRLTDRESYRLAGVRPSTLPDLIAPGRAFFGDPANEAQFALIDADASGAGQAAALAQIVVAGTNRPNGPNGPTDVAQSAGPSDVAQSAPFRVDVLPPVITLDAALRLPAANAFDARAIHLPIAVGGDEMSLYRVDFASAPGFVVAGPRGTGRSTALATAVTSLVADRVAVCVIALRASPLTAVAAELGLSVITATDAAGVAQLQATLADQDRCAVIVDDAETVHGSPLDDALIELPRSRAPGRLALIVAANIDDIATVLRGVLVEAKRGKRGLLLSPTSTMDGTAFGGAIPRPLLGRAAPGRGVLPVDGEFVLVQLPVASKAGGR
jgi:S-DNA-T family DNA segregation ATPase FtsK/SpoIIIE